MKVAQVYFNDYNPNLSSKDQIRQWFSITDWAEQLVLKEAEVTVFLRGNKEENFQLGGVHYRVVRDYLPGQITNRHIPIHFIKKIRKQVVQEKIDIVQSHNLNAITHQILFRQLLPDRFPILIQDHASLPNPKYVFGYRYLFSRVQGILFSAPGQEKIWQKQGWLREKDPIYFVMENSSHFKWQPRPDARSQTSIDGHPVFLWVGNLTDNKDPITILKAFKEVLLELPSAKLWMFYKLQPLENQVKAYLNSCVLLREAVTLMGAVPRADLELIYNSADYFLLGSHKEGSGYALLEAMACGVIPIVTDIPSFRYLLGQGQIGKLWEPGHSDMLLGSIKDMLKNSIPKTSQKVRDYFAQHFAFDAITDQLLEVFMEIIKKHKS